MPAAFTGECFPDYGPQCKNRIGHSILTKDEGKIDEHTGVGTNPENPRGKISKGGTTNFGRAVSLAVQQVGMEWSGLQAKIHDQDDDDANQIICALVQDDTIHDCTLKVELNFTQTVTTTDKGTSTICGTTRFSDNNTETFTSQIAKGHGDPGYAELPFREAEQSQPYSRMDEPAIDQKAKLSQNGSGTSNGQGCASGGGGSNGPNPCPGHTFTAKAEYSLAVDKHHQVVIDGRAQSPCANDTTELPLALDAETLADHELDGSSDTFQLNVHRNEPFSYTNSNGAGTVTESGTVETTIKGTVTITYGKGDEDN